MAWLSKAPDQFFNNRNTGKSQVEKGHDHEGDNVTEIYSNFIYTVLLTFAVDLLH